MISTDLCDYYDVEPGFKLFDIFGLKRLREAVDRFDELKFIKNQKLLELETTLKRQCIMLKGLKTENLSLKKSMLAKDEEIAQLKSELECQKKKATLAESSKISATNGLEKLSQENTNLRVQLNELSRNYNELADMHDELCNCLRRGETDISLDKLYSRKAV